MDKFRSEKREMPDFRMVSDYPKLNKQKSVASAELDAFFTYVINARGGMWCVWSLKDPKTSSSKYLCFKSRVRKRGVEVDMHTVGNELWAMRR